MDKIEAHEHAMTKLIFDALDTVKAVRVYGPRPDSTGAGLTPAPFSMCNLCIASGTKMVLLCIRCAASDLASGPDMCFRRIRMTASGTDLRGSTPRSRITRSVQP